MKKRLIFALKWQMPSREGRSQQGFDSKGALLYPKDLVRVWKAAGWVDRMGTEHTFLLALDASLVTILSTKTHPATPYFEFKPQ